MSSRNGVTRFASLLLLGLTLAACGGGEQGAEPTVEPGGDAAAPAGSDPAAPAAAPSTPGAAASSAAGGDVAMGQQVFQGEGICYTCHGQNGVGTALAPNLTDDEWLWVEPGQDPQTQIATIIRTGVSAPKEHPAPMPPMGGVQLSEDQIQALTAYILSL